MIDIYRQNLSGMKNLGKHLTANCPFCREKGLDGTDSFFVVTSRDSFFCGYFRCMNRCVAGGFPLWFAHLLRLDPASVPGYDPDREPFTLSTYYPPLTLNQEINSHVASMTDGMRAWFQEGGVGVEVLAEMHIGFNGRYLVYPYFQRDGNCYAARCVFPGREEDFFWHGNETFFQEKYRLFNVQDIRCCENGTLFLCQGENSLLALKQLGFPAVAVPDTQTLGTLDPELFSFIRTLFLVTDNSIESGITLRTLASRIGYKVRPFKWPVGLPGEYSLWQLAKDKGSNFRAAVSSLINTSRPFSPFVSPAREYDLFQEQLSMESGESYAALQSGFPLLDKALGGIHGITIIGGAPKAGKSTFVIQVATQMALAGIPVLYYDFENGRQKIYQRTLCRLSQLSSDTIHNSYSLQTEERIRYQDASRQLQQMFTYFRVISDRQVSPEIMRRHIDFIRHETKSNYTVVVIDSLHKLPFKNFSKRRTGIDAWLRQIESIRDELHVSFLVVSELLRGDGGSYKETPHLGVFKGSGDIEYSADNAMVLNSDWDTFTTVAEQTRKNKLWLVASREHSPGLVAQYQVAYPFWEFVEQPPQ